MITITVTLKDMYRSFSQKFVTMDPIMFDSENDDVIGYIEIAKRNFQGDPSSISVKACMDVNDG